MALHQHVTPAPALLPVHRKTLLQKPELNRKALRSLYQQFCAHVPIRRQARGSQTLAKLTFAGLPLAPVLYEALEPPQEQAGQESCENEHPDRALKFYTGSLRAGRAILTLSQQIPCELKLLHQNSQSLSAQLSLSRTTAAHITSGMTIRALAAPVVQHGSFT